MMNTNIDINADLTDPAKELLTPPSKSMGQFIAIIIDTINNTALLPLQKHNIKMRARLEKYAADLRRDYCEIPQEQRAEPSISLWGQTFESLKWNLDDEQEYIRSAFKNILLADVDKRTKSSVKSSFVEIVNQLDRNDAELIRDIVKPFSAINIFEKRIYTKTRGAENPAEYYAIEELLDLDGAQELMPLSINLRASFDNLERLGLVKVVINYWWGNRERVNKYSSSGEWSFDSTTNHGTKQDMALKGRLEVTDFGKMFIDICFKE